MKKDRRYKVEIEWVNGVKSVSWFDDFDNLDNRLDYLRTESFYDYVEIIVTDNATNRRMNEFYEVIK